VSAALLLFLAFLVSWALMYPGGPLGFIMLYRVSYYVTSSIRTSTENISEGPFGGIWVKVPNEDFWIRQDKDVHHELLSHLADSLANNLGFRNGLARIDKTQTSFRFR